tara:strand:- start:1640 stop:2680 length:1041 start_codon:yes stop_codon:yes gene_type:complete
MAWTINNGSLFMNPTLYTGNGSTQSINVGFQPDFTWIKTRSGTTGTEGHRLQDAVRGSTKYLESNGTALEGTQAQGVTSFTSTGFNLGTDGSYNYNTAPIVSWNWKAGTTSGIVQGGASITPSAYSFNQTSGFSIIKYQGTGANATVPHGLNAVPKMILFKSLANSISWIVYSSQLNISSSNCLRLNGTNAAFTESAWNDTRPTTSVFSLGPHNEANNSSGETIAYCFADVQGFSKMGSYVGNGSTNGTFVYTGFKPAFVLYKKSSGTENWFMHDNKRQGYNPDNEYLFPDLSNAEGSLNRINLLSNGFKATTSDGGINGSGATYIFMAFAENPITSSTGVPSTAR